MDTLTVGYTSIKPAQTVQFGDEWDFSVKYAAVPLQHHSQLTKQMQQQSSLTTILVVARLHSQQCTTKLVRTAIDSYGLNFAF